MFLIYGNIYLNFFVHVEKIMFIVILVPYWMRCSTAWQIVGTKKGNLLQATFWYTCCSNKDNLCILTETSGFAAERPPAIDSLGPTDAYMCQ